MVAASPSPDASQLPSPFDGPASLQDRAEALAVDGLLGAMRLLGVDAASAFGGALLGAVGPLIPPNKVVLKNLATAFPDLPDAERRRIARRVWANIGRTMGEFIHVARLLDDPGRVHVEGLDVLERLRAEGRQAVLVSGHFANWEVIAGAVARNAKPVLFAVRPINNPLVNRRVGRIRAGYGIENIVGKGTEGGRALIGALKAGMHVAILNDQKFGDGPEVDWFGTPAPTNPAPAKLALKYGAQVVPVRLRREGGRARFTLTFLEPLELPEGKGETAAQELTARINAFLEGEARAAPEQWFWVHRRWPKSHYKG